MKGALTEIAVDLIVIQRSCSSLRVSVKRVSPALAPAMIPALLNRAYYCIVVDMFCLPDEGVSESGFTMIDVSDNGHITDVLLLVHDLTDLVNREVNHFGDLGPPG